MSDVVRFWHRRHDGNWVGSRIGAARCHLGLLLVAAAVTGCEAAVNQELVATATPYPLRSPVSQPLVASPEPRIAVAVATGQAALATGDWETAEAAFGTAIAGHPRHVAALAGRAAVRLARHDLDGARRDLDAAVALAPRRADLYLARGEVAEHRAYFAAAEADYDQALALDPGDPVAHARRADLLTLVAQGDPARYQRALGDYNRALALTADFAPARLGRIRLLLERASFRGDPADLDRAVGELDALASGAGGQAAALVRARVLAAIGDIEGARAVLAAPVLARTDDAPVEDAARKATEAVVALAARDWAAAAAAAEAALQADPATWEAYRIRAEAELERGDAAAALAAADRLLAQWPDNGPALYLRGAALARLGRSEEAREALGAARDGLTASPVYLARIDQVSRRLT